MLLQIAHSHHNLAAFAHRCSSGGNGLPCKMSTILLLKGHQLVMNISCVLVSDLGGLVQAMGAMRVVVAAGEVVVGALVPILVPVVGLVQVAMLLLLVLLAGALLLLLVVVGAALLLLLVVGVGAALLVAVGAALLVAVGAALLVVVGAALLLLAVRAALLLLLAADDWSA
ncbi:hypothetical protein EMCRGX_G021319 [Ephydatia muelleri]